MAKIGTLTLTYTEKTNKGPLRKLEDGGYKLDLVKSGTFFDEYVITDGEWNPGNEEGKRVYTGKTVTGWETVEE